MKKLNLRELPLLGYIHGIAARRENIETHSGDAEGMHAPLSARRVNRLVEALHPAMQHVRVSRIREQSPDTKTYTLIPDTARGTTSLAWFAAGQYLSVFLHIDGTETSRPYSISSSPRLSQKGAYELTVKRTEGGLVSPYILDRWTVGTAVDVTAPEGTFTYEPLRDAGTVVGLAGGSGITPFVSLAQAIRDGDEDCTLILLYGCRTEGDILFREELDAIAATCPQVRVIYVLSDETITGDSRFASGLLTADLIRRYAPKGDYSVFACGSQGMYRFLDRELPTLGLPARRIRKELFGEYRLQEGEGGWTAGEPAVFRMTVIRRGESRVVPIRADETVLRALERAGYTAPARCRSGSCGFCRARLLAGDVYIPASVDERRMADSDHGIIHPCCTFARSDLTLEIAAESGLLLP